MCRPIRDEFTSQPAYARTARSAHHSQLDAPQTPAKPEKRKIMRLTITQADADKSETRGINPIRVALGRLGKNPHGVGFSTVYVDGQEMQMSPSLRQLIKAYAENRMNTLQFPVKGLLRAEGV